MAFDALDDAFNRGFQEGLIIGKEEGWSEGFQAEKDADYRHQGNLLRKMNEINMAFGDSIRVCIVKVHGSKHDNPKKIKEIFLQYYMPTLEDSIDVDALFEHLQQ